MRGRPFRSSRAREPGRTTRSRSTAPKASTSRESGSAVCNNVEHGGTSFRLVARGDDAGDRDEAGCVSFEPSEGDRAAGRSGARARGRQPPRRSAPRSSGALRRGKDPSVVERCSRRSAPQASRRKSRHRTDSAGARRIRRPAFRSRLRWSSGGLGRLLRAFGGHGRPPDVDGGLLLGGRRRAAPAHRGSVAAGGQSRVRVLDERRNLRTVHVRPRNPARGVLDEHDLRPRSLPRSPVPLRSRGRLRRRPARGRRRSSTSSTPISRRRRVADRGRTGRRPSSASWTRPA